MAITHKARAGTLESGDILVTVQPSGDLSIHLESPVKAQFGDRILDQVKGILEKEGIKAGRIDLEDQGALACTIEARLTTAIRRSREGGGEIS